MGARGQGTRGRTALLVLGLLWALLGVWWISADEPWLGLATCLLAALHLVGYLWPRSAVSRFMEAPLVRRKRPADR